MGITLSKIFSGFDSDQLYQLYIHSEVPTVKSVCESYYRITDKEAVFSVFSRRKIGKVFFNSEIVEDCQSSKDVTNSEESIYKYASSRKTPIIYLMRDFYWYLSNWFNSALKEWLNSVKPDVIYLASGDYAFIYRIARIISAYCEAPLFIACFDDYYLFNKNQNRLLGDFRQRLFMKVVKRTINHSYAIIGFNEKMGMDYSRAFNKNTFVLYAPVEDVELTFSTNPNKIAYFGNLGMKRDDQLLVIGEVVNSLSNECGIKQIEVYTNEKNESAINKMVNGVGIQYHSAVNRTEMYEIMKECVAVIHTESFDPVLSQRVAYSISTKIPEALQFGPCILAFGPNNIASIDYLVENDAGFVATSRSELIDCLKELLLDKDKREKKIRNAREVAKKNHNSQKNNLLLRSWFQQAIEESENGI